MRKRWTGWAVGAGLVLLGAVIGAVSVQVFVAPILGEPTRLKAEAGSGGGLPEEALVTVGVPVWEAAPGETFVTTWVVTNTGRSTWAVDRYRFVPDDGSDLVIALPETVPPGREALVRTVLTAPDRAGLWRPAWRLTGPHGPVAGGRLQVAVTTGEAATQIHFRWADYGMALRMSKATSVMIVK